MIHIIFAGEGDSNNAPPKVMRISRRQMMPFVFTAVAVLVLAVYLMARLLAGHWIYSRAPVAEELVDERARITEAILREKQEAEFSALRGEIANLRARASRLANTGRVLADRLQLPAEQIINADNISEQMCPANIAADDNAEVAAEVSFNINSNGDGDSGGSLEIAAAESAAALSKLNAGYEYLDNQYGLLREQGAAENVAADTLPMARPVLAKPGTIWQSSGFGMRKDPFTGRRAFHAGYDYATRQGTPIVAAANGIVSYSGRLGNYGKAVRINHGRGVSTLYGHMHKIYVKERQYVRKGEAIGEVGNTGRSTGPHLHYELRLNDRPRPIRTAISQLRKQRQLPKQ